MATGVREHLYIPSISVKYLTESVCPSLCSPLLQVRLTAQHYRDLRLKIWPLVGWEPDTSTIPPSLVPAINPARVHVILEYYWELYICGVLPRRCVTREREKREEKKRRLACIPSQGL